MMSSRVGMAACIAAGAIVAGPLSAQEPGGRGAAETVSVQVDATAGRLPISPYLFGRNGIFEDEDSPALAQEAGVRITRESFGNNCTKYNWRKDISSHPDWYNNVYKQGWHDRAKRLSDGHPDIQGLFCFQVLGWVAKTDEVNFREQEVNPRPPVHDNLCGGGDARLYLEPWGPADTVGILDYWFGPGGLGLDPDRFRYWHMDNEPECWASTHDDIASPDMTAEECVQRYVAVAREVKSRAPWIRLMAPGFTSEWMWWNWNNQFVDGLPWAEYFIKRMAEESAQAGVRLLDVVDFHSYIGGNPPPEEVLQEHRVFYDPTYEFPRANGCKRYPDGGWNEDQRVERIFGRTEEWVAKYFGPDSGIGIGVTEGSSYGHGAMVDALWYASALGTFADHGVLIFTPWGWNEAWWEVLHLFSRYGRDTRVESRCSGEPLLSAYSSISSLGNGMTVILLNRDPSEPRVAEVEISGFVPTAGPCVTLQLSNLPDGRRTFFSHTRNALVASETPIHGQTLTVTVPPYSLVAVVVEGASTG